MFIMSLSNGNSLAGFPNDSMWRLPDSLIDVGTLPPGVLDGTGGVAGTSFTAAGGGTGTVGVTAPVFGSAAPCASDLYPPSAVPQATQNRCPASTGLWQVGQSEVVTDEVL